MVHVYETGAIHHEVNSALISMENSGELYPFRRMDEQEACAAARKHGKEEIKPGTPAAAELHRLWNEHVKMYLEDAKMHGYDPYDGLEVTDHLYALGTMMVDGQRALLPKSKKFQRTCYERVKDLIQKAGGKYRDNGFDFDDGVDVEDIMQRLTDGELINDKKKFQAFFTPPEIAAKVVEAARLEYGDRILEPSAGQGALLDAIPGMLIEFVEIDVIEIQEANIRVLQEKGYNWIGGDFLEKNPKPEYDRILMNPPFTRNQDIDHVVHAYNFLLPKGRLVAIMSTSWVRGQQAKQQAFREWLEEQNAQTEVIDAGAFKESGTQVATMLVTIQKD